MCVFLENGSDHSRGFTNKRHLSRRNSHKFVGLYFIQRSAFENSLSRPGFFYPLSSAYTRKTRAKIKRKRKLHEPVDLAFARSGRVLIMPPWVPLMQLLTIRLFFFFLFLVIQQMYYHTAIMVGISHFLDLRAEYYFS